MKTSGLFDLSGKVGIVTGGSRGIGRTLALGLAHAGADVVVAAGRRLDLARDVAGEIEKMGKASLPLRADVSNKEEVGEMVSKTLERFGKVDILINNAAINIFHAATDFPLEEWNKVLGVDLTGAFLCTQAVGRIMIEQKKGKIINIASVGGMRGSYREAAAYDSSKAGLMNLTRSLAVEWGKYNINVNAIAPGMIETDLTRKRLEDHAFYQHFIERVPLGKIGQPDDLVGVIIFLSSEASNWLTGQTIVMDGGQTLLDVAI